MNPYSKWPVSRTSPEVDESLVRIADHELLRRAVRKGIQVQIRVTDRIVSDRSKNARSQRPIAAELRNDDSAVVLCETFSFGPILTVIPARRFRRQVVAGREDERQCFGVSGLRPVDDGANGQLIVRLPLRRRAHVDDVDVYPGLGLPNGVCVLT